MRANQFASSCEASWDFVYFYDATSHRILVYKKGLPGTHKIAKSSLRKDVDYFWLFYG